MSARTAPEPSSSSAPSASPSGPARPVQRHHLAHSREIGERIKLLLTDHGATRTSDDSGYFSLAGAQPKTPCTTMPPAIDGAYQRPHPTTHILKPAAGTFDGFAENEHFCLRLARETRPPHRPLHRPVFRPPARHHRGTLRPIPLRRHSTPRAQEDACQALARPPQYKYQSKGGPSAADIIALIRQYSADRATDEQAFVDSLAYAWLIGGTDAHAKNYSLLIAPGGAVRLAPLYDLSSALPYPRQVDLRRAALAMKIGGVYKLRDIHRRQWEKCATELRLDPHKLLHRIRNLAAALPDAAQRIGRDLRRDGLKHEVIPRLVAEITQRSLTCHQALAEKAARSV